MFLIWSYFKIGPGLNALKTVKIPFDDNNTIKINIYYFILKMKRYFINLMIVSCMASQWLNHFKTRAS